MIGHAVRRVPLRRVQRKEPFLPVEAGRAGAVPEDTPHDDHPGPMFLESPADAFQIVVGGNEIVVEECDDLEPAQYGAKRAVALGGEPCPAENRPDRESVSAQRLDMGLVGSGKDDFVRQAGLPFEMRQEPANEAAAPKLRYDHEVPRRALPGFLSRCHFPRCQKEASHLATAR